MIRIVTSNDYHNAILYKVMTTYPKFSEWVGSKPIREGFTGKQGAKTIIPLKLVRAEGGTGIGMKFRDEKGAEGKTTGIRDERSFKSLSVKDEQGRNVWSLRTHDGQIYQVLMDDKQAAEFEGMFKKALASLSKPKVDPNDTGMNPDTGEITDPEKYKAWQIQQKKDVFAVKDFVKATEEKYQDIAAERITGHAKFKKLIDAIPGYTDQQKAGLVNNMVEYIAKLREDRKKNAVSGSAATPVAAAPATTAATGGFGSWLKKKFTG